MWFKNFFQSLSASSSRRRTTRRRPQRARLCFEAMEERCVLSYAVIDLGSLADSNTANTWAYDINDSGQVVGWSYPSGFSGSAFLWQNGIMTAVGASVAYGINDVGQIVGYTSTGDGTNHGFLLTPEDTDGNGAPDRWFRDSNSDGKNDLMLDLGPDTVAYDVNNAGQVVGYSGSNNTQRASLWQNGVMTDLGTLGGSTSYGTAINDAGQVTGISRTSTGESSAFVWQGGVMHDIGPAADTNDSDINQSGQVATGSGQLWTPTTPNGTTGSFQSLGTLPPNLGYYVSSEYSSAIGMNDLGHVVGISHTSYYPPDPEGSFIEQDRGFVWADGVIQDLG